MGSGAAIVLLLARASAGLLPPGRPAVRPWGDEEAGTASAPRRCARARRARVDEARRHAWRPARGRGGRAAARLTWDRAARAQDGRLDQRLQPPLDAVCVGGDRGRADRREPRTRRPAERLGSQEARDVHRRPRARDRARPRLRARAHAPVDRGGADRPGDARDDDRHARGRHRRARARRRRDDALRVGVGVRHPRNGRIPRPGKPQHARRAAVGGDPAPRPRGCGRDRRRYVVGPARREAGCAHRPGRRRLPRALDAAGAAGSYSGDGARRRDPRARARRPLRAGAPAQLGRARVARACGAGSADRGRHRARARRLAVRGVRVVVLPAEARRRRREGRRRSCVPPSSRPTPAPHSSARPRRRVSTPSRSSRSAARARATPRR